MCGLSKDINEFYKRRANKDGLMSCCKLCDNMRKYVRLRKKSQELGIDRFPTLEARKLRERGLKYCAHCEQIKDLNEFYSAGTYNGGFSTYCGPCMNEVRRERPHNKEVRQEAHEKYKDTRREYKLKTKFGITAEDYEVMLEKQGGVCAICGKKNNNRRLAVDHCHKTGKVRELLCTNCNTTLGRIQDDPEIIDKMILYLEKHKGSENGLPKNK